MSPTMPFLIYLSCKMNCKKRDLPVLTGRFWIRWNWQEFSCPERTATGWETSAALAGIDHERPHQADSDALVTAQLLLMFMDRLLAMPRVTLSKLVELSKKLKNDLSVLFEEQLYKKDQTVETLAPDLEIYRGIALKKYRDPVFNPPGTDKRETSPYPSAAAQKELLFKKAFPRSEERSARVSDDGRRVCVLYRQRACCH